MLERLDPNPEFFEAKRGAAVGVFQMIIAGKEQVSGEGGGPGGKGGALMLQSSQQCIHLHVSIFCMRSVLSKLVF